MGTKEKNQSGQYDLIGLMGAVSIIIGVFMPIMVVENLALIFSAWFMVPGIILMVISVAKG